MNVWILTIIIGNAPDDPCLRVFEMEQEAVRETYRQILYILSESEREGTKEPLKEIAENADFSLKNGHNLKKLYDSMRIYNTWMWENVPFMERRHISLMECVIIPKIGKIRKMDGRQDNE